jgi:hypothetical protein
MLTAAVAQERERMLGVWKLEALEIEFQDKVNARRPSGRTQTDTSSSPPKGE